MQAWSSGGYDWFFNFTDDIRDYNGSAHTGTSSWAVRGFSDRSNLFCNIPLNIKGLWANFYSFPNNGESYTLKGFSANGTELYSKTVTRDPSSFNFIYVTLDWQNVKRLNIAYAAEPGTSLDVDDIEYTPAANAYPYYLSTNNAAPGSNTVATSVATGTTINLNNLQPATTYYLWMRTYNGDTYGNWTPGPITFTTKAQVLPVQLTAFNAKLSSNTLMLDWQTASEKNSSHFLVQLSKNGSAWTDITKVPSKAISGNSATSLNYTCSYPLGQINR
ncbi:MAG: fibronectin type III domain-containing protein [Sphingobacteriaceae bacterium]|nr:MAG: fibronectin type III domain-containing protein [Sphingobacteriaceae bacterium]